MNKLIKGVMLIVLVALICRAGQKLTSLVSKSIRNEKIMSYNAGYRAGKLEAYAELVECNKDKNQYLVQKYEEMTRILLEHGELDNTPFPCGE